MTLFGTSRFNRYRMRTYRFDRMPRTSTSQCNNRLSNFTIHSQYLAFQVVELQLTFQWSPPTPPPISYSSQPIDFSNPYLYDQEGIFSQPVPYDSSQLMTRPPQSSTGKRKNSWNSPSRSPEPRLPGNRKTAQPKRRRQQSPGSGSDDSDADVTLCWRCRKYNDNVLHPPLICVPCPQFKETAKNVR
jgi:hypothetical protein